jgi:hypothetical protein
MTNISKLENLNQIKNGLFCYTYNDINFLLNLKNNTSKFIIYFHG